MASDQRASFEKQLQLGVCHRKPAWGLVIPETGKSYFFKPLHVNAEAGTIPKEDLGTISTPVDEKKEVATEDLTGHVIADELMEPVVRLA